MSLLYYSQQISWEIIYFVYQFLGGMEKLIKIERQKNFSVPISSPVIPSR